MASAPSRSSAVGRAPSLEVEDVLGIGRRVGRRPKADAPSRRRGRRRGIPRRHLFPGLPFKRRAVDVVCRHVRLLWEWKEGECRRSGEEGKRDARTAGTRDGMHTHPKSHHHVRAHVRRTRERGGEWSAFPLRRVTRVGRAGGRDTAHHGGGLRAHGCPPQRASRPAPLAAATRPRCGGGRRWPHRLPPRQQVRGARGSLRSGRSYRSSAGGPAPAHSTHYHVGARAATHGRASCHAPCPLPAPSRQLHSPPSAKVRASAHASAPTTTAAAPWSRRLAALLHAGAAAMAWRPPPAAPPPPPPVHVRSCPIGLG